MALIAFCIEKYHIISFRYVGFIPVQLVLVIKFGTIFIDINFAIPKPDMIISDIDIAYVSNLTHAWQSSLYNKNIQSNKTYFLSSAERLKQ